MLRSFLLFSLAAVLAPSVTRADFVTSGSVTRFCSDGINTFADGDGGMSCSDSLSTILSGNAVFPGGNVQLAGGGSTLTGDFAANGIVTFVGLSDADWFANPVAPTFGAADFANTWYAGLMSAHGAQVQTNAGTNVDADIFDQLVNDGVFTRLSMPNVAYVNNSGGTVTFGLAGDQDGGNLPGTLLTDTTVSAVVNVNNGNFMFTFQAGTDSGQTYKIDGLSHNANFQFSTTAVPEPSAFLYGGLISALAGLGSWRKRRRIA